VSEAVIDANLAVKFVLKGVPYRQKVRRFLADCTKAGVTLLAPPLLESEADSALRRLVYGGYITPAAGQAAQTLLNALPVQIIYDPQVRARARAIAEQFQQQRVYDATYAALAELRGCEFWTADKAFYDAVQGTLPWVHYIGDYTGWTPPPTPAT
jgi:predicted nucleic acid-binding protein